MKKILIVILFINCSAILGQEYKPLLDSYNEWKVTSCYFGCITDGYYTDGDTLVDGCNYKILDGYHFISRTILLREDVPEKKVYLNFIQEPSNTEYLLYDFSLNIGDSIDMKNPISPFIEDAGYYDLDSVIPRPLVDGNDYRHFYLSPSESNEISINNAIWIEGAGSLSIINAPSGDPDINGVGHLSCFFKNGVPYYTNLDSIDACEPSIVLGLEEFINPLSDILITNNSTTNTCHIKNIEQVRIIDMYDIYGKRITSFDNFGDKDLIIDTSTFPSGIYIIIAYTKQFSKRTFKIIIE